jgi:hypothetical protein
MPRCAGVLDVYVFAQRWNIARHSKNLKLDTLSRMYGYGDELHEARDDAMKAFQVMTSMIVGRSIAGMIDTNHPRVCTFEDDAASVIPTSSSSENPSLLIKRASREVDELRDVTLFDPRELQVATKGQFLTEPCIIVQKSQPDGHVGSKHVAAERVDRRRCRAQAFPRDVRENEKRSR